MYGKGGSPGGRNSTTGDDQSSEDSEEDEVIDDLPIKTGVARGPRMSVSAEVFGKFNI